MNHPNPSKRFDELHELAAREHHRHPHPDIHLPWLEWSTEETLHVAVAYSNPYRWRTRRELFNDCIRHLRQLPNIRLYIGELAYGDRPFEVTVDGAPGHYQFRSETALFHKENLLNRVIANFAPDWKYGAWIDGDFHFTRHDLGLETIHQLQHHPWVQMFSQYADLTGETYGSGHRAIGANNSFAFNYVQNGCQLPSGYTNGGWSTGDTSDAFDSYEYGAMLTPAAPGARQPVGATGGAWAFTRDGLRAVGSLLEHCILGHADWFMTFGLVGYEAPDMHGQQYTAAYRQVIREWQNNAAKIHKNIGYVDAFAVHHFHGSKNRRGYSNRDLILVEHAFDPVKHLRRNFQGILELQNEYVALRDAIRRYFVSRTEDDPNLYNGR